MKHKPNTKSDHKLTAFPKAKDASNDPAIQEFNRAAASLRSSIQDHRQAGVKRRPKAIERETYRQLVAGLRERVSV